MSANPVPIVDLADIVRGRAVYASTWSSRLAADQRCGSRSGHAFAVPKGSLAVLAWPVIEMQRFAIPSLNALGALDQMHATSAGSSAAGATTSMP